MWEVMMRNRRIDKITRQNPTAGTFSTAAGWILFTNFLVKSLPFAVQTAQ